MANADSPKGMLPIRHMNGDPWNGAVNHYSTAAGDSTAIFIGDPVKLSGTSQTINGSVYLDVDQAATGDVIVGVVISVIPITDSSTRYREASSARIVAVCDNPHVEFEIQEVSGGTALTANDAGLNANFVVGSGNTYTGMSGVELNNATEATGNTLDLQILRPINRADNEIGEHCKWAVRINRHQFANQVAGA